MIGGALDEHRRVVRALEKWERLATKERYDPNHTWGRTLTSREAHDARVVTLDSSLISEVMAMRPVQRVGDTEKVRLSTLETSRVPLDRALIVVLDGVALYVMKANGKYESPQFGSLVFTPGLFEYEESWRDEDQEDWWAGEIPDNAQMISHSLMPLPDQVTGSAAMYCGISMLGFTVERDEDDEGHFLVEGIMGGLASGKLVIADADDPTPAEIARMDRSGIRPQVLRRPRPGDRIAAFHAPIIRTCMLADGTPKHKYTAQEAQVALAHMQAKHPGSTATLRPYKCERCSGRHPVFHLGRTL